jgi:hypothetical protein
MYDNLTIKAETENLGKSNLLIEMNDLPFNQTLESTDGVITKTHFWIKNLNVTIKEKEIVIIGSICKYLYGNNQRTLTLADTKKAFDKLSDELQIPVDKFQVMRIEAGTNIVVNHKVDFYFQFLGPLTRYKFYPPVDGTYYYRNTLNKLVFYDKMKEQNRAGVTRIPEFQGKNVLRYEITFLKSIAKSFRRSKITVEDLYNPEFYKEVVLRWQDTYKKIYKHRLITFDQTVFTGVKGIRAQIFIAGVQALGGEAAVLKMIEQEHRKKAFDSTQQRTRLIKDVKTIMNGPNFTQQSDGIIELDQKIDSYANQELSTLELFQVEAA